MQAFRNKKLVSTHNTTHLPPWRISLLVIGGALVGLVSGLFGGGGGTLLVPLMTSVGQLDEKRSHTTSIAAILPLAIVTGIVYLVTGTRADLVDGSIVVLGVSLGGILGTLLLTRLRSTHIKMIFYIVMIVAGVRMIV